MSTENDDVLGVDAPSEAEAKAKVQAKRPSIFDAYETDGDMEVDGVWIDLAVGRFKIARAGGGNIAYATMLEKTSRPIRRAAETGLIAEDRAREVVADVFAATVVKGWVDVVGRDGKAIEYSIENAKKLLRALPNLLMELQQEATKMSNFKRDQLEAEAGN